MFTSDKSRVDVIKQVLASEAAFDLLRELVKMEKGNRFEINEQLLELLKKYPEALDAYQQLIRQSQETGEFSGESTASKRTSIQQVGNLLGTQFKTPTVPSTYAEKIQESPALNYSTLGTVVQTRETSNIIVGNQNINSRIINIQGSVTIDLDEPPVFDLQSYAMPEHLRHPAAIYCELGHTYYARGRRYWALGQRDLAWSRFARAAQAYRSAIQEDPKSTQLRHYLADALAQQQKFEEALKTILEVVSMDFRDAQAALEKAEGWLNEERARSLHAKEQELLAVAENAEITDNKTSSDLFNFLGRIRYYQADYAEAAKRYEQVLKIDRDNYFALEGWGVCLWKLNQREQAVEKLRQAVQHADLAHDQERQEKTRQKLVDMLIEMHLFDEALSVTQDGLNLQGTRSLFFQIAQGRIYLAQRRYNDAIDICRQVLTQDPSQVEACVVIAEAYYETKDYTMAITTADQALALKPDHLIALKVKAGALIEQGGDVDQAARLLQIYLQRNPRDIEGQYLRIKSMRLQGQRAADIKSGIDEILPHTVPEIGQIPLWIELAQAYLDEKELKEALDIIQKINEIQPSFQSARLAQLHGEAYNQLGQTELAISYYQKGLELEPDNLQILKRLAETQSATQEIQKAIQNWEQYLQASPKDPQAWMALGQLYSREEDWQSSLSALDHAFEQTLTDEQQIDAYRLKGDSLRNTHAESKEIAAAYYEAARRLSWRGETDEANYEKSNALCRLVLDEIDSQYVNAYWTLADNLRILSYKPDYERLIDESLAYWKKGASFRLPKQDDSWAYLTRALICEKLSEKKKASEEEILSWEALTYIERELLLSEWDEFGWAYLCRFYRNISQESAALVAGRKAVELNPTNIVILQEMATILADTGRFEEADNTINQILEKSPTDSWAQEVKAYVLQHLGKYQEALAMIEKALKTNPENIWSLDFQADCYRSLAHYEPETRKNDQASYQENWEKARSNYTLVWEKYTNESQDITTDNLLLIGWAAYQLGKFNKAQLIFEDLIQGEDQDHLKWCKLGLSLIAQGKDQMEKGKEILSVGIAAAKNARELNEFVNMDLQDVKNGYVIWPYSSDEIKALFAEIQAKVSEQLLNVATPLSPMEELQKHADQELRENRVGSWTWFAANAGLARLLGSENRWVEAATSYETLLRESDHSTETLKPFPEARIGLQKAVESLYAEVQKAKEEQNVAHALEISEQILLYEQALGRQDKVADLQLNIGDMYCLASMQAEALRHYDQAAKSEAISTQVIESSDLQSRYAFAEFLAGNTGKLREHYRQAIAGYRQMELPDPGSRFGQVCQSLIQSGEVFWNLEEVLRQWSDDLAIDEALRASLLASQHALVEYLDGLYELRPDYSDAETFSPTVTPIMAEFADNLVPKVDDKQDGGQFLFKDIPAMRESIHNETGVRIPGLRARSNPGLPYGAYVIQLDEIPVANGIVQVDMYYCTASTETLESAGIFTEGLMKAVHPRTGQMGYWIPGEDLSKLTDRGVEFWSEMGYVILHIETILRRHLANFLNMQDIEALVDRWAKDAPTASLLQIIVRDQSSRIQFARILRALARELVPLTNASEILSAIEETGLGTDQLWQAVRAVRLRVKQQLPGNRPGDQLLQLLPEIENTLMHWRRFENGQTLFAASAQETHELKTTIREWLRPQPANVVLVTRLPELRPFLRHFIESEFPDLMVLSQEEQVTQNVLLNSSEGDDGSLQKGASLYAS